MTWSWEAWAAGLITLSACVPVALLAWAFLRAVRDDRRERRQQRSPSRQRLEALGRVVERANQR